MENRLVEFMSTRSTFRATGAKFGAFSGEERGQASAGRNRILYGLTSFSIFGWVFIFCLQDYG
jgi:hypothetical protein